jgi:hypothetical protein
MDGMTVSADLTAPLAGLDRPLNAMSDFGNRVLPWMWWPAGAPRPHRPYGLEHHAVLLAWNIGSFVAYELLVPARHKRTGVAQQVERALSTVGSFALQVAVAGAWDRRAAARRRMPWRRFTG